MIATDPLSLVFVFCMLVSGGFLIASTVLGLGHPTDAHLGAHDGFHLHLGHDLGSHAAHGAHVGVDTAHGATGHSATGHAANGHAASEPVAALQTLGAALLSALNLYGLLVFFFVFGILGYLLHNFTQIGVVLSLLLPLVLGAAGAIAIGTLLIRLFRTNPMSLLDADSSRFEGRLGQVSLPIRVGGIGEIIFSRPGAGRQSVSARAADGQAVATGTEVVILGYQDGIASVQTWDSFAIALHAGQTPLLQPLDPQP